VKASIFLILTILPLLLIPAYAESHVEVSLTTDKPEYAKADIIVINGSVSEILASAPLVVQIIHDGSYVHLSQLSIAQDGTFTETILAEGALWEESGEYLVIASYDGSIAETTFQYYLDELPPINLITQTDKEEYYSNDYIQIYGTMTGVDWDKFTNITHEVYYSDGTLLESINGGVLESDGTFDFTIDTSDNPSWNESDYTKLVTSIQNSTGTTFFNYYNTPNMENEVLYYMIEEQTEMINSQQVLLESQQLEIDALKLAIEELTTIPGQTDAPIIISLIVDDPDDLDEIYSIADTITIQFDFDTNEPGGSGIQTKLDVNDLFTFSDNIGQAYSGQWVTPDTFVIAINSLGNAGIIINSTTVTPAQITPILSSDGLSDPSSAISPVLSGDFGVIPLTPAPVINQLVAYDLDNADNVYSVGDGIIIAFDIDTNMPGGEDVIQDKQACDNMFAFSHYLGDDYNCRWTAEHVLEYAILNITNAAPPVIGVTTVTPTGITPILSSDGLSYPSTAISPAISNTWGSP